MFSSTGSAQCGGEGQYKMDQSYPVKCVTGPIFGKLTVRVYGDLSSDASDESFAIDNVTLARITNFDNPSDFEGWNCGKIMSCGDFGNVCGGYKTKGKGDHITKTFDVPPGKYSVALDFIKIDSWFVCLLSSKAMC